MFLENIKLAFKDFRGNKLRTILSVLGIVIGVGSVITITTLGQSAAVSIQGQVAQAGLEMITIIPRGNIKEVRRVFVPELAEQIESEVAGVEAAISVNQKPYDMRYAKNEYQGGVVGTEPAFIQIYNYEVAEGRFIDDEDNSRRKTVIVLGAETAQKLFPNGEALGKYVRLYRSKAMSFKVVGVMKTRSEEMRMDFDASAYVPYETYVQRMEAVETVQSYTISTVSGADVLDVADRLDAYFLELTNNAEAYRVMSPATMAEMFTGITATLNLFLTGIAAISLVVGGIGIMNIMLVSVAERTKEIGVRKALGAAPRVIRGQFLTESVALTVLGGVIGMGLGTALGYLGTNLLGWSFAPDPSAYAIAVAFSSGVGIFFGLYPAIRASRIDPVQALAFA